MMYRIGKFICSIVLFLLYRIKVEGLDNLPGNGGVILCANHRSLWDPVLMGCSVGRKVRFMAKEELFKVPVLGMLIRSLGAFPVKRGKADIESIKTALTLLKEGNVLGMFPEGTRVRKGRKSDAKAGAALIAVKSGVPIVPMAISGSYRFFSKLKIKIGEPFELGAEDRKHSIAELKDMSEGIMAKIRSLVE